jgi:hypothetical protein
LVEASDEGHCKYEKRKIIGIIQKNVSEEIPHNDVVNA